MAKIGLIDVDGHNFPNLALMKLSAYHKSIGDTVEWAQIDSYDKTYMAKVFTFTKDYDIGLGNYGEIVRGGTGYNASISLPEYVDNMMPDYSLYPQYSSAYGFLTRGCPNKCSWCIVPKKEGDVRAYADIEEFLDGRNDVVLMDNNVLSHDHGLSQIEKIVKMKLKVDFNQGLDARIIAKDKYIAELLSKVKWSKYLRMACDTKSQIEPIRQALENLNSFGLKNYKTFVYVLVKDINDALERVEFLRDLKSNPFAQPYRDFTLNQEPTKEQKQFARWVNHKAIFKTVKWEDYHKSNKSK